VLTTVADTIAARGARVVLAHSLGSVVAYETLWARPDLEVELLITLGSPLAPPDVVFDRLDPAPRNGKGRRPPGVRRWINVAPRASSRQLRPRPAGKPRLVCDDQLDLTTCSSGVSQSCVGR
jgi:hypothetical protein